MRTFGRAIVLLLASLAFTGCASGAAPGSISSPAGFGSPPPGATVAPSASAAGGVTSPDEAARRVLASDPRFADVTRKDPNAIGQCCWYQARQVEGGYQVDIVKGWGDCPAGCINSHRWTYAVAPTGQIQLIAESGDPLPSGASGEG
jgi:hypothetical protein